MYKQSLEQHRILLGLNLKKQSGGGFSSLYFFALFKNQVEVLFSL